MTAAPPRLTGAQWRLLTAAWLGWGFDILDALLFNYVAPSCIPTLLGLPLGSAAARAATASWTGTLTALLLVGWAIGGVLIGHLADRIGRRRALIVSICVYAVGTGACALATSLTALIACRLVASLGIGGEFATGATLIAETVPESRRVLAGAFLQTASPLGLFLATAVTWLIAGRLMAGAPELAWRFVLGFGVVPVLIVLLLRVSAGEPAAAGAAAKAAPRPGLPAALGILFGPRLRPATLSALAMSVLGLFTWWSCNAFLPTVAAGLGAREAAAQGLTGAAAVALAESWKATASTWFNVGGLVGALITAPVARGFGRRGLFAIYFAASAAALVIAFGAAWPPAVTLRLTALLGLAIYGIFGAFAFYLPELFPPNVRGLGAGLSYNIGRLGAALGPFLVGAYSAHQADPTRGAMTALTWIAVLPVVGVLATPFIVETRANAALPPD